jgi:S1-C subfamily serine protease
MQVDRRGTVTAYDLIVAVEGQPIGDYDDLYQALDGRKPGEEITIRLERNGKQLEVTLKLQSLD